MITHLHITLGILMLLGCSSESFNEGNIENRASSDSPVSTKVQNDKTKFKPDTSVWKYSLLNSDSVDGILRRVKLDEGLKTSIISKDNNQILTMKFHPEELKYEFLEFNVKYNNNNESNFLKMMNNEFITESSIKLSISVNDLLILKGAPSMIINKGEVIIYEYKIQDYNSSLFLQKYNMNSYYAFYTFLNGKLIEITFGFD